MNKLLLILIISFACVSIILLAILLPYYLIRKQSIILGPIIGKVTESTARVLVEFGYEGDITMILTDKNEIKNKFSFSTKVFPRHPAVFKFENLQSAKSYVISFDRNMETISGIQAEFQTLSGDPKNFKFVSVSCNDIRYSKQLKIDKNLWSDMAYRVDKGEIDYIFHIEDQVYLDHDLDKGSKDGAYQKALDRFSLDFRNYTEEIRELIREEYRMTFNFTPMLRSCRRYLI